MKICTYRSAFYGEHGLYSRCLARYLREMRTFLDVHPHEVVIVHFQRLSQLEKSEKRRLVTSLFQVRVFWRWSKNTRRLRKIWKHKCTTLTKPVSFNLRPPLPLPLQRERWISSTCGYLWKCVTLQCQLCIRRVARCIRQVARCIRQVALQLLWRTTVCMRSTVAPLWTVLGN